jgi:hypothetical protein
MDVEFVKRLTKGASMARLHQEQPPVSVALRDCFALLDVPDGGLVRQDLKVAESAAGDLRRQPGIVHR